MSEVDKVWDEPVFMTGEKVTFEEAFPDIEELMVEVRERYGEFIGPKHRFSKKNVKPKMECSNPNCYQSGLDIQSILRELVSVRETDYGSTELCHPLDTEKKGGSGFKRCNHFFEIVVHIEYK